MIEACIIIIIMSEASHSNQHYEDQLLIAPCMWEV